MGFDCFLFLTLSLPLSFSYLFILSLSLSLKLALSIAADNSKRSCMDRMPLENDDDLKWHQKRKEYGLKLSSWWSIFVPHTLSFELSILSPSLWKKVFLSFVSLILLFLSFHLRKSRKSINEMWRTQRVSSHSFVDETGIGRRVTERGEREKE